MNGVIVIRKEAGMTSFDAVRSVRRITGERKAGHGGTLDPNAEGVLPVFLGNATKLADFLSDGRKAYDAELTFGFSSDTEDIWGTLIPEEADRIPSDEEIRDAFSAFRGRYLQVPPMYSAKKVDGVKLYKLARKQIEIERAPEERFIDEITVREISWPKVRFHAECSKGTYIRTLCTDIGKRLGIPAVMSALLRTHHGRFTLSEAVSLGELSELLQEGRVTEVLIPTDRVLDLYPEARISESGEKALLNGNILTEEAFNDLPENADHSPLRVYDTRGRFLALYGEADAEGVRRPLKMFLPEPEKRVNSQKR